MSKFLTKLRDEVTSRSKLLKSQISLIFNRSDFKKEFDRRNIKYKVEEDLTYNLVSLVSFSIAIDGKNFNHYLMFNYTKSLGIHFLEVFMPKTKINGKLLEEELSLELEEILELFFKLCLKETDEKLL